MGLAQIIFQSGCPLSVEKWQSTALSLLASPRCAESHGAGNDQTGPKCDLSKTTLIQYLNCTIKGQFGCSSHILLCRGGVTACRGQADLEQDSPTFRISLVQEHSLQRQQSPRIRGTFKIPLNSKQTTTTTTHKDNLAFILDLACLALQFSLSSSWRDRYVKLQHRKETQVSCHRNLDPRGIINNTDF